MQQQQAEKLKQLIQKSALLSPAEKSEWADLLIVMNDKQASELEAILNSDEHKGITPPVPAPAAAPAPMRASTPQPARPPLSHISNLPSKISNAPQTIPTAPKPRFPLPTPPKRGTLKQWETNLRRTVEEKELSSPKPEGRLTDGVKAKQPARPPVSYPKPTQNKKVAVQGYQKPRQPEQPGPKSLNEPKDASLLTLNSMRTIDGGLVPALKKLVGASNYFEVLAYLEKSPLYQTYLDSGRAALSSPGGSFPDVFEGKSLMTKAEFEAFSDLLKSIQFS